MKRISPRISPLVQMTMALVALASTLVILGSLFFDAIPDRDAHQQALRKAVSEALAVQLAEALARDDPKRIEAMLGAITARTEGLRSIGVRRADGSLVVDGGGHTRHWSIGQQGHSTPSQISVPLNTDEGRWGQVEFAFAADDTPVVIAFFKQPLVQMLMFISAAGWLVFGLYMRRALQHLDPSTVVPERVQGAFDAMAEGIVVLDSRGQVMMSNKAFRALHPEHEAPQLGKRLAGLAWLAPALPQDPGQHPWTRAMSERAANAGTVLQTGEGDHARRLLVNAAPISDAGGAVRGCMVTLTDMTDLHRAHEALTRAMQALESSKREVEHTNAELERLATRDPLTGVLNRRAFHSAYDALLERVRMTQQPLTCLMIDIDHFKSINDTHGHGIGDRVIQEVARRLQDSARGTDLLCRWGGEEFCLVAAGMSAAEAQEFAERVRIRLERECAAAVREAPGLRMTASVGVANLARHDEPLSALIERADQALYQAKRNGRNRVVMAQSNAPLSPAAATTATALALDAKLTSDHRDAASEALNPQGWAIVQPQLLKLTLAEGRVLGCLVLAVDGVAEMAARYGEAAPGLVTATLGQWLRESAPAAAQRVLLDERTLALIAPGLGLDDAQALARHLLQRVRHGLAAVLDGAAPGSLSVSIGIDALPAASPAVGTLVERATQAMVRVRREGGNGVELFRPPRASNAQAALREPR